jgi:hypothetical protein
VRAIVEEAQAWHTYVMAHAYSREAIRRSVDFGVRSIEHGNLIDRATAEHVTGANAFVVPTLVSYDALHRFGPELGFPKVSLAKLGEVREAGLRSLEILRKAGVKIGFGTDLLGPMHRYQSREFVIRAETMAPFDIIRSATQSIQLGGVNAGRHGGANPSCLFSTRLRINPARDSAIAPGQLHPQRKGRSTPGLTPGVADAHLDHRLGPALLPHAAR